MYIGLTNITDSISRCTQRGSVWWVCSWWYTHYQQQRYALGTVATAHSHNMSCLLMCCFFSRMYHYHTVHAEVLCLTFSTEWYV
jgi:hypothetical protein